MEWNSTTRRLLAIAGIVITEIVTVLAVGKAGIESSGGTWEGWASVPLILGPLVLFTFLGKVLLQLMSAGGKEGDVALKAAKKKATRIR